MKINRHSSILIAGISIGVIISVVVTFLDLYSNRAGIVLPNGKITGGDFICFHMAGNLLSDGRASPYDFAKMFEAQQLIFQGTRDAGSFLAFVYPPLVGTLFGTLSHFELIEAYYIWLGVSVFLALVALLIVVRTFRWGWWDQTAAVLAGFAFSPLAIYNFAGGQTAALGLMLVALLFVLMRGKHELLAGIVFSLSYYKPALFFMFLIAMIVDFRGRFLAGFLMGAALLVAGTVYAAGLPEAMYYLQQLWIYSSGGSVVPGYQFSETNGVALIHLLSVFFKGRDVVFWSFYLFLALSLFIWLCVISREIKKASGKGALFHPYLFATQISMSLFLAPYIVDYDLSLLLIPFGIFAAYGRSVVGQFGFVIGLLLIALFYLELFVPVLTLGSYSMNTLSVLLGLWVLLLLRGLTRVSIRAQARRLSGQ